MTLRPYQQQLVRDVEAAWSAGARNVLMRLDTGGGKTVILSDIVQRHPGASAVIAHRQELVGQLSLALARNGVRHRLIAAQSTIAAIAADHVAQLGRSYYDPGARCAVASVDTLIRAKGLESWAAQVTLWVTDECFPAGTLVDGRPIETLRPGDTVTAFNEATGGFEPRAVVRIFKNPAPSHMMRIAFGSHHVIEATHGHPFWTQRGWVNAAELTNRDMVLHLLRDRNQRNRRTATLSAPQNRKDFLHATLRSSPSRSAHKPSRSKRGSETPRDPHVCSVRDGTRRLVGASLGAFTKNWTGILLKSMFSRLPSVHQQNHDAAHQSSARGGSFGSDAGKQPDAHERDARFGKCTSSGDGPSALDSRGERSRGDTRRTGPGGSFFNGGFRKPTGGQNGQKTRLGLSDLLQNRLCSRGAKTGNRGGRTFPHGGKRSQERYVSRWARVDRVEVFESNNPDQSGTCRSDGFVYNIEVEGLHTYVANGVVVHNCHHVVNGNKWTSAISMFTNPSVRGLLPTATPQRADGKGLGRHADGVADALVQGPPMRWLIDQGFLTDYRIVCPESDMQLLDSDISASGDWSTAKLRAAARASHIVGDVVASYQRWGAGKLGVTFCPDTETAADVARAYMAAGVRAGLLTGETDPGMRRHMLRQFAARDLDQLVVVDIVSEGFDLPAIEVASFARKTASLATYMQQFGRTLRPMEGKQAALIIDHVGNFLRHGPPDRPRNWTLDRRDRRAGGGGGIPLRVCLSCFQPYERVRSVCPYCQTPAPPPVSRGSPAQVEGDLAELDPEVLAKLRGEVAAVDMPTPDYGRWLASKWVEGPAYAGAVARHEATHGAQARLRAAMTEWCRRTLAAGYSDRETHRKFWADWGIDVVSAQALGAREAVDLAARIERA